MSPTLQITALVVATMSLWIALLRAPHWFCRSLHRHRLWKERDHVADDIIARKLPKDHPAVRELLEVAEWSAREGHKHTVMEMFVWRAIGQRTDKRTPETLAVSLDGLTEDQLALLHQHRDRIMFLTTSSMLLGSWLGLLTILRFVVPARREILKGAAQRAPAQVRSRVDVRATILEATNEASRRTQLGCVAREFIDLQERAVLSH